MTEKRQTRADDRRAWWTSAAFKIATVLLLALVSGVIVFTASARKEYTVTLLAKSLEAGVGQVLIEPENHRNLIRRSFTISDNSGNQAMYVVELPARKLKSVQIAPLASMGRYAIDRVTLASDLASYQWDSEGVCTRKLRQGPASLPEEACGADSPALQTNDAGAIVISAIPDQGMERGVTERLAWAVGAVLLALLAGLWLWGAVTAAAGERYRRLCTRVLWLVIAALYLYQVLLIYRYAVDVPYYDEWVYFKPEALPNGFSWSWVFSFFFEHKIVFTYLMAWLNLKLFHLDFVKQIMVNFAIFTALLAVLVHLVRDKILGDEFPFFPAFIVFLLSPLIWENHLWGFQSQIHLMVLFSLLALQYAFDDTASLRSTAAFILFTLCAVYSFASGMVFALVCLVLRSVYIGCGVIGKRIDAAAGWKAVAFGWLVIGAGTGLWFYGFKVQESHGAITLPTQGAFWVFFLNVVSYGFGVASENLFPGAVCLLVVFAPVVMLLARKELRWQAATWRGVTAIVAIVVILAAVSMGRAAIFTPKHARYAEFGMLLIPLAAAAWWRVLAAGRVRTILLSLFWLGCFVGYSDNWSADKYRTMRQVNLATTDCIERYYRGEGDGYCTVATPAALDYARQLNVSFAQKAAAPVVGR